MARSSCLRSVALVLVCLLLAAGAAAVMHPTGERVSFDSVLEIWSSVLRDVDHVGLTVTRISTGREMEIGKAIGRRIDAAHQLDGESARARYLAAVGAALVPFTERKGIDYSFTLVVSPEVAAYAIPGGRVYVTTGMLDLAQSEAELAAVLGHEISHIDLRHCVERLQYALAAEKVAGGDIAAAVGVGHDLLRVGFGKEEELEADVNGVILAAKAGYDPRAAIAIFERFSDLDRAREDGEDQAATMLGEIADAALRSLEEYAADHPPTASRIAAIRQALDRNAAVWAGGRFYVGRRNNREQRARAQAAFPDEWVDFTP